MKKIKFILILLLTFGIFGLTSCGSAEKKPVDDNTQEETENKCKITYMDEDSIISTENVSVGDYISSNINTNKDGYTFDGWYLDKDFNKVFDPIMQIQNDITLYAKYSLAKYNITFDTDGGNKISSMSYTIEDKISLPIPKKTGCIFQGWKDVNGNIYRSIQKGTKNDLTLKATYKKSEDVSMNYGTKAENFDNGVVENKLDSLFTYNCEIRGRIATWINPYDSQDTKVFSSSAKLGDSKYFISFTAPGNGKVKVYVQNGSGSAKTQKIVISSNNAAGKVFDFSGTEAIAPYPAGSPIVAVEMDVVEGGEYIIRRSSGTIDIFAIDLTCMVEEKEVNGISTISEGKVDYIEGSEFDSSKLKISAIHGKDVYISEVNMEDVFIDSSKIDMSKPGTYDVIVKYGQFDLSYKINVYEIIGLELGFNQTYESKNSFNGIYVNGKVKTVYNLNEKYDSKYLTAIVNTKLNDVNMNFIVDENLSYEEFDSSKSGTQDIKVKYNINGKEVSASYKIYVVDTNPYINSNNEYVVTVDKSYDGNIGIQNGENGNMFNKISQALEFLQRENVPTTANKIIYIKSGFYKEKLEINIPNLKIIGSGICKATYEKNANYNKQEYEGATIIEWDSLYGIADESGYYQVTDSTATVAVRENAINCIIKNLTLSNYWNCEEVFQDNIDYLVEKGIAAGTKVNDHRALALIVQADKFEMENCSLLGYQDTVEFMTGRQFISNTHIAGNTDFIFGTNATTYFYKCNIHVAYKVGGSGYVTAYKGCNGNKDTSVEYGFIFDECSFTADSDVTEGTFALGRPWGAYSNVMIMNSSIDSHISIDNSGRYVSMSGVNPTDETVNYREYNNIGAGAITSSLNCVTIVDSAIAEKYNNISIIFGSNNGNVSYNESWIPNLYIA